jgi:hypothetical protein
LEAGTRRIDDLFSAEAEELSLFSPAGRGCFRAARTANAGILHLSAELRLLAARVTI